MTIKDLLPRIEGTLLTEGSDLSRNISTGYACDLLSWVLAHGQKGMAWATVQTHINVVAIAVLMEMSCIILAEGNQLESDSLAKAKEEGLTVLTTRKTAYEVCGLMMGAGIAAAAE